MSKNIHSEKITLRENVIGYIYSHELLSRELNDIDAYESGMYTELEIKYIKGIAKNYEMLKKLILKFTKDNWTWARMAVLTRSILIYGAFELQFNEKPLVIDVLVQYAKNFAPDDSYKFINSILDKVGKYYETIKANKKAS